MSRLTNGTTMHKHDFSALGNKMNAVEILADLTPHEAMVFKLVMRAADDKTNRGVVKALKNKTEQVKFSKGYKKLVEKNVLYRYKKENYIINPDFIIPLKGEYEKVKEFWNNNK